MKIRPMLFFRPALVAVLFTAASVPCRAETRSGFWVHLEPSAAVYAVKADFSELSPFCAATGLSSPCSLKVADVDFSSFSSVKAPRGILHDSALGAAIHADELAGNVITFDREGLFYLDSMMKRRGLTAPPGGYADSCAVHKPAYFLKTSEGGFVAMIKVGEYIGGINRTYYYWAYRPESDRILYKGALCEQPESLSIIVDAFSGRPNPVFTLRDSGGIAEIVRQIYVSVNTLLDPSVKRTGSVSCSQSLGYRKLTVSGMFGLEDVPSSSYMPTLEICNGAITYYKVSPVSSVMPPQLLHDPGCRLEKLIIRVCCNLGLAVTDPFGEVSFCTLIPDSLKDFNGVRMGRQTKHRGGTFEVRGMRGNRIVYSLKQSGRFRVDFFDTRGRRVVPAIDRYHCSGEHTLELKKNAIGSGVFFIDFHFESGSNHVAVPVLGLTAGR
ncbi:MAG: hypothetical protein JXA71_19675 [Chitinispirillaceae bacterium]|nr:hypothetical protein [Chitinispirillaceae bacterium]